MCEANRFLKGNEGDESMLYLEVIQILLFLSAIETHSYHIVLT